MLTRRDLLKVPLAALFGGRELEAVRHGGTAQSTLWLIGPPGLALQRYVGELATDIYGPLWHAETVGIVGGWHHEWCRAIEFPFLFDDAPYQGDLWTSAEDTMRRISFWCHVDLKFIR